METVLVNLNVTIPLYVWHFYYFLLSIGICYGNIREALNIRRGDACYDKCYPKDYIKPSKWMRKVLGIKNREILIWSFLQIHIGAVGLLLGPINCIVLFISDGDDIFALNLACIELVYNPIGFVFDFIYYIRNETAQRTFKDYKNEKNSNKHKYK